MYDIFYNNGCEKINHNSGFDFMCKLMASGQRCWYSKALGLWPNNKNNFNFPNEKDPTLKGTHASSSTCVSIKIKKYVTQ
jgi:hypothetical protein